VLTRWRFGCLLCAIVVCFAGINAHADAPQKQVLIESKFLELTRSYSAQIGLSWPMSNFGDEAKMGLDLGLQARQRFDDRIDGSVDAIFTLYGAKELNDEEDKPSITGVRLVYNFEWMLRGMEKAGEAAVVSSPRVSIIGGVGLSSIRFSQGDFTFWDTGPMISVGSEVGIPVGDRTEIAVGAKYNHVFTDENYDFLNAGVRLQITPQVSQDKRYIANTRFSFAPFTGIGFPMGDFGDNTNPGIRFGGKLLYSLNDNINLTGGIAYQFFGEPNEIEGVDRSVSSFDLEAGALFRLPVKIEGGLVPHISTSAILTNIRDDVEYERLKRDDGDTGVLVMGGLMVEKKISKKAKVALLSEIPILGVLFKDDTRSKARTELMVIITPRILESEE
jgi:Flp pilus assembly secretin CpaC